MYLPSDHSILVNFAKTVFPKFDIDAKDFEHLVVLGVQYNRQDILDYILVSKEIPFNDKRRKSLVALEKKIKKDNLPSCFICVEPFNKSTRTIVKCKCDYTCCKMCAKQYLLNQVQDAHCMNCKIEWDREFMTTNFDAKFISTEFKHYRENVLFERELGMMPQTQIVVDNIIAIEKIENEMMILQSNFNHQYKILSNQLTELKGSKSKPVERREFIRKCPNGDCRGYLSQNLKCNICEMWACGDCREVKGDSRDSPHTCNLETIESIKVLNKEVKECPKCSYKIYKTQGCNQMFCTPEYGGCGTAFDWVTLKIETKIHNPHYFDYMRKLGGGVMARNPDDIICGRELDHDFVYNLKNSNINSNINMGDLLEICRKVIHTTLVDLNKFTPRTRNGNIDLRIKYLRNQIDQTTMKSEIQKREKQDNKNREVHNIIRMYINCMTDIFYRLIDNPTQAHVMVLEMHNLIEYVNGCLEKISKSYKCTCWIFYNKFNFVSKSIPGKTNVQKN